MALRPVNSVDGMTAPSVPMDPAPLEAMTAELLAIEGVCGGFYDPTPQPTLPRRSIR